MKTLSLIGGALLISIYACTPQSNLVNVDAKTALENESFTFHAENVNITNPDVSNILSRMPGSSASQMSHLSDGYTLKVAPEEIIGSLPYFGRMYTPSFDSSKNSLDFKIKDFGHDVQQGKRNKTTLAISPRDQQNIRRLIIEAFPNGKAYLLIESNDREPISYDGYITK